MHAWIIAKKRLWFALRACRARRLHRLYCALLLALTAVTAVAVVGGGQQQLITGRAITVPGFRRPTQIEPELGVVSWTISAHDIVDSAREIIQALEGVIFEAIRQNGSRVVMRWRSRDRVVPLYPLHKPIQGRNTPLS